MFNDNAMVLAHRGAGEERIWGSAWEHIISPSVWSGPSVLGGGAFNSTHAPSLCFVGRGGVDVDMAWKGSGTDERIFISGLRSLSPSSVAISPAAGPHGPFLTIDRPANGITSGGQRVLAWRSPDNTLFCSFTNPNGTWAEPQQFGATTGHGPVMASVGGVLRLIWTEVDNGKLWWARMVGNGWQSVEPVPVASGAALASDTPAVAANGNQVFLAWKGVVADQRVWFMSPGGSPTAVTPSQGGVLTSHGPALAITSDEQTGLLFRLFWKGAGDQHIWWSSKPLNGPWSTPSPINPGSNSNAGPAVASYSAFSI
jgi:hypothetical protein